MLPRIVVRDPEVARRILFDHAHTFSNRGVSSFPVDFNGTQKRYSINTVPFGPEWRAFRCNLTSEILHPSRLGRLGQFQREAVKALVASLSSQCRHGEAVLVPRESLHKAIFPLLVHLCFGDGVGVHHIQAIQKTLQEFFDEINPARALAPSRLARLLHWKRWARFAGTFHRLNALISPLVEERRRRQRHPPRCGGMNSYVDSLVELQVPLEDGNKRSLRNDQIATLAWEFLGAGTWTVVSTIEWTLAHLIIQQEIQRKLHQEISGGGDSVLTDEHLRRFPYLRAVMLESLRLNPSVPFMIRDAVGSEAAKACGATALATLASKRKVPVAGCSLVHFIVSIRDIGWNIDAWTNPEEFIPERFLAGGEGEHVGPIPGSKEIKMMPFGAGRRSCPGAGLGMLHIKMFLAAVIREFEWAPVADHGAIDLSEKNGFFKVMKTPLRARITPRCATEK